MELKNVMPVVFQRENDFSLILVDVSRPASPLAEKATKIVAHALFELFDDDFENLFNKSQSGELGKIVLDVVLKREREYVASNKELFDNYIKANEEQYKKDKKDPYFKNRDDFEEFYRLYLLSAKFTFMVKNGKQVLVLAVDPIKEQPQKEEKIVLPESEPQPEPEPVVEKEPEKEPEPVKEESAPQPEPVEEASEEPAEEGGKEININRRTFEEKLHLISEEQVSFYEELKQEALSYGLKSRVSSNGDAYSYKKINYLKIGIGGRTLKLHYRLEPADYKDSPIPVEDDSAKKLFADIPLVFRVKSNLGLKRAKQLLGDTMLKAGLQKLSPEELAKLQEEEEPKEKVEKPKPEPKKVVIEKKPEPKPEPVKEEPEAEEGGDGFPNIKTRTFYEKLLRVRNETRHAYKEIKDYGIEKYALVSRVSTTADSLSYKRKTYVKLQIAGKTLKIHYRLDPKAYADSKIPVEDDSSKKAFEDLPLCFRVKSELAMKRAMKLIDDAMAAAGIEKSK
ncbi:MAG: hypothetical protein J5511_01330 [Bacilli bacterium]|nr:hypothetical protein [Bacilli bacterium]